MDRIKLSSSLIFQKGGFILIFFGYVIMLISSFNPLSLIFILLFALFAYQIFYLPDNVEFDADNMYIVYKDGETKVNLKDVYYVSPMGSLWSGNNLGRIKYRFEGSDYQAQFMPRYFSSSFKKFKQYLIEKKPNAVIRGYSPISFFDN